VFISDLAHFPATPFGAHNFRVFAFLGSPPRIVYPKSVFTGHVRQADAVLHVAQLAWQVEHPSPVLPMSGNLPAAQDFLAHRKGLVKSAPGAELASVHVRHLFASLQVLHPVAH